MAVRIHLMSEVTRLYPTQSKIGTEATTTIQSQQTELWTKNSSAFYLRGQLSTGQAKSVMENKNTVVFGILSGASNLCLREAQRKTFIPKAKAYKLLNIKVFFLLDEKTTALEAEQKINQDIVFLNATHHGWEVNNAMKLHKWLQYVLLNIKNVILIGRMDDDAFVCAPQMFERLNEVKDKLLYYGYPTGPPSACPTTGCVDEMFLIVGAALAQRVANRHICQKENERNCLKDGNAGHRFRSWIQGYKDFVFVNERANRKMIWYYRNTGNKGDFQRYKTYDFCSKYLLFHKANVNDIYDMQLNNSLLLKDGYDSKITKAKTMIAKTCLK